MKSSNPLDWPPSPGKLTGLGAAPLPGPQVSRASCCAHSFAKGSRAEAVTRPCPRALLTADVRHKASLGSQLLTAMIHTTMG